MRMLDFSPGDSSVPEPGLGSLRGNFPGAKPCDQSSIEVFLIDEHLVLTDGDGREQNTPIVCQTHLGTL